MRKEDKKVEGIVKELWEHGVLVELPWWDNVPPEAKIVVGRLVFTTPALLNAARADRGVEERCFSESETNRDLELLKVLRKEERLV